MAAGILVELQDCLRSLKDRSGGESSCQEIKLSLQKVRDELSGSIEQDRELLAKYRDLVWGRREDSVVRTALVMLGRKETMGQGGSLMQGLLLSTETSELIGAKEFENLLIFAAACFGSAKQIRASRLKPVVKMLENAAKDARFTNEALKQFLIKLRDKILFALGDAILDTTGISLFLEVVLWFGTTFPQHFDSNPTFKAICYVIKRIEFMKNKAKTQPVTEIEQIFSLCTMLLKSSSVELKTDQLSILWTFSKTCFSVEMLAGRSQVVLSAAEFMRGHIHLFFSVISSDFQNFYISLLNFICSSDVEQNREVDEAAFELATQFVNSLPLLLEDLRKRNLKKAQEVVKQISALSYRLTMMSYRQISFGVLTLGVMPKEAFDDLARSEYRLLAVSNAAFKILETVSCGSSCSSSCSRARLLRSILEVARSSQESSFHDLSSPAQFYESIQDLWFDQPTFCPSGIRSHVKLFHRLISLESERSRSASRFLHYVIETNQVQIGVQIWNSTCYEITDSNQLSDFVSTSIAILAKELVSAKDRQRETVVSLFVVFYKCGSVSTQLSESFSRIVFFFLDNFMKSQDLSQLLIVASLARQNLRMSASIDGPSSDQETESGAEEGSSDRKVVEAMDVLIQLLTQTESLETVSTYLPCLALLPRASFEDETRTNKIARLFRRCVEGNSDERVCKPIAKMCEENPALGSLAALSVLKGKESEANWRMLSLVSFADTRNQGIGEISSECGSSKFLLNIGSVQVDIVPFLKEFSNCFKSEEMLKLYSGALFSVVSEILKRNNPGDEELLRFCVGQLFNHCEETIYEFYNFPTYLSAAVKVLLWAQPSTETQRSRFSKILTTMVARNENFLEFIASEVSKGGGLNFAEEILRILDGKGFDYLDTAPILLKHLLGRPSARLDLLDGVDIAQWNLLGIQEAVVECLHSELTNLEQMKFAWDALCDRSFLNLKMFLNERNGEKIAFLVEQLPGIGTEELAHVLKNHLDNPKWVSMAKKLLDGDECAFRDFVFSLKDDEKFANLVFSSAEPKTGAVLFESYWHSISDLDRKKKLQDHIALHYDLKSLLLSNISNVPHIDTFVNRVTAYDELVVKGILPAPVSLRAVVDKILQSSDGLEILLKGPLWSALLNATAKWEMNTEEVARSAFELFSADRKDLLPCFRKHIEENPVRFIQLIPASVTSILTNILEAGDVQESVKDAVLDYVKNFSEDQIFSLQIFRLLRVVEKTPWKREEFRFLPAKIAARKSNKLQCEFLNLLKFMPIDERFYEMLVTAWIPLRYSESDEKLHAFLESEDCLLWKNLLLTVFLIEENNPGPKKIIRWLDKNSGKLKNSAPLLEAVISLCVEGGDSLPRLPSIHELRQFKLIEDVLIRMIDNMSADALKGILAKSMEDGSLNQVLTNGFGTGLKEMALLVVFKKFIEKNKEWGERIASQELKTSLVQRCLCHLKNPLNDGSDPFLKWKLHCHAFNLIATIYSKLDSLHPEFLNEVFSSAAVWDRIAGESTVVGMEFGDQISSKSGIRKRKASQKVESQDEHDFTKSPENKKIDVVSLASAKRIFDFDSHPCLHALISLASLWFDVPGNESEKLPLWLKIFTDVIRPDLGQVNTKIIFLRFLHACGKRFGCLQSVLDVAASQCLATVLLCGASIDCTFVQESFALCSEIGSNLAQFVFDKIFEGPTNSDRCAYLKLFRKFYNSNIHQINTRTLEESVSPSVSWCRNEVLAIFWRKNRSFAISNVGRFDWKRVAGPMFDFSGATSEDSRNSLAKMIAGAFGFAKQMGDAHLSTSLLELVRKYLQKLGTNEEVLRAIQIMSEGCDEIVDEFYEKVFAGIQLPNSRYNALRLLKILFLLRKVDLTKKIVPLLSLELNTPNRLLLLSAIEVLCRSNFYDHSAKKNLLEKFLSRFPEEQPKSAHLAVFIQLHENFPETVAQYINSVWGSLNSELKGFLVKRWIQKNARIPTVCDRLNPELALRLIVGNGDIVEFFAGGGDKRKASELLSSFLEEEPQFVLEMLKGNSVENKILKSCVDTAVMKFLPRAAWKAMKLLDHSTEDFQEILEIYGSPRNIQPAKVRDDLEALRIARNCFSPEDALDFLRRCKNLSVQATSLLDRIFEGHFTLEEFMDDESEGELLRFIQNLMILKTENWSSLQSLTVKDPSRIEVEIFCRAQLENKKADKNFWTQTASVFHFEHQIYHLEHRIQQLDHGSKVVVLLRKLKNGILHVWSEVDEALRVVLLRRIRAISDAESMIRVLSGGDINERLLELCKAWLTATECRCTHLRRIRFLKSLTRHAGCSARSFALLSTAIATNYIQLLKMGISLEDPQTDSTADFLLKDRRMELLTELRKFLPGCEERTRGALISDAEKLADNF